MRPRATYGTLFSGVEGAGAGLEDAGMTQLWACECDRQCQDVLRFLYPDLTVYPDVKEFPAHFVDMPDVLWMSPPCQDLSVAGLREGLAGARSGLFFDAVGIVRTFLERGWRGIVCMEQVHGLLSSNGGGDFRAVLRSFGELGPCDLAWRVLDSRYFGVPQRRRRIYIVVDFGALRAGEVLSLADCLSGGSEKGKTKGQEAAATLASGSHHGRPPERRREDDEKLVPTLAGTLGGGSGQRGFCDDTDRNGAYIPEFAATLGTSGGGFNDPNRCGAFIPEVAHCVTADMERLDPTTETLIPQLAHTLRAEGFDASEDGTGRGTPIVPIPFDLVQATCKTNRSRHEPAETSPTINCAGQMAVAYSIPENHINRGDNAGGNGAMFLEGETPAVDARNHPHAVAFGWNKSASQTMSVEPTTDALQASSTSNPAVMTGYRVRRLMPIECNRLQGWKDGHTRWGINQKGEKYEMKDGPQYRMCGNGVTRNVARWMGRNLGTPAREGG